MHWERFYAMRAGGRTDRQTNDEASIRFLQFCDCTYKVRNNVVINTLDIKSVTRRRSVM